jgi:hypothetical protein
VKTEHVKRAFKYRFHPTDAQTAELSRTFGCVRKVYNHLALQARTEAWYQRQVRVNYNATSAMLTALMTVQQMFDGWDTRTATAVELPGQALAGRRNLDAPCSPHPLDVRDASHRNARIGRRTFCRRPGAAADVDAANASTSDNSSPTTHISIITSKWTRNICAAPRRATPVQLGVSNRTAGRRRSE